MTLTPGMWDTLQRAKRAELRRAHDPDKPGTPPWPAPWQALYALERRGLLQRDRIKNKRGIPVDRWTVTDEGRLVLDPPMRVVPDRPRRLRVPGGSTRPMVGGVWEDVRIMEPEPIDTAGLADGWRDDSMARLADSRDRVERARQLARKVRAA